MQEMTLKIEALEEKQYLERLLVLYRECTTCGTTNVVRSSILEQDKILASDLRGAFRLRDTAIFQRAQELSAYGLGGLTDALLVRAFRQH